MRSREVTKTLSSYPAFFYSRWIDAEKGAVHIVRVNFYVAIAFMGAIFVCSALDRTLIMAGEPVGLLEHPAIFAFLLTQCVVLYSVAKGLELFAAMPTWSRSVLDPDFIVRQLPAYMEWLRESTARQSNVGAFLYRLLVSIGFCAFAWNSISNQDPMRFVGFDFWDSALHVWGYSITRVYKLYMWVLFLPALFHVELLLLIGLRGIVAKAAEERSLALEPFHPDECGGMRAFMDSILVPLVPALAISSLLAFSAVLIHRKLDITTAGALLLMCSAFLSLYAVLATALRKVIITEKWRQLDKISSMQNECFFKLILREGNQTPEQVNSTIEVLGNLSKRVREVPNWPQLKYVLRLVGLAGSSPVVSWLAGQLAPKLAKFLSV